MKIYPSKPQSKPNHYRQNLREIAKISKYQPIPSIPQLSDDFNFTFLNKDYDYENPFLKKRDLANSQSSKKDNSKKSNSKRYQHQQIPTFDPSYDSSRNSIGKSIEKQQKQPFKLPYIEKKSKNTINSVNRKKEKKSLQRQHSKNSFDMNKSRINNQRSLTNDTRIDTEDASIEEGPNFLIETKSITKELQKREKQFHRKLSLLSKVGNLTEEQQNQLEKSLIDLKGKRRESSDELLARYPKNKQYTLEELNEQGYFDRAEPNQYSNYRLSLQNPENILEQDSQEDSESTSEQFDKECNPGPGYYSISQSDFDRTKKSKNRTVANKSFSFGAKGDRFNSRYNSIKNDEISEEDRMYYELKKKEREKRLKVVNKKEKKYIPFNSAVKRSQYGKMSRKEDDKISPLYYEPRNGIEEQLIKKIQRNFKGSFGQSEDRFKTQFRKGYNLGPGQYNPNSSEQYNVEDSKPSHYFASEIPRF